MSDRNVSLILFIISLFAIFAAFAFYAAFYYTTSFLIHDSVQKTLLWSGLFDRQIQIRVEKNADHVAPAGQPETVSSTPAASGSTSTKPSITVLSPNGGEQWQIGSTYSIRWESKNLNKTSLIQIVLSGKGAHNESVIADSVGNTGVYNWTVGTYTQSGSYYLVGVYARGYSGVGADYSDAPFSIVASTSSTGL